ncbi:hypothetical protein NPIL_630031 [Nephila pilipes]|uniref:Uncharacterized protein n=1 Tax=Nephila pilipes TaxID=299642 RepID=A0A8X6R6D8_NEPPI|nr:hypothetical protein NPIL_630031 [Nephila pilipes]
MVDALQRVAGQAKRVFTLRRFHGGDRSRRAWRFMCVFKMPQKRGVDGMAALHPKWQKTLQGSLASVYINLFSETLHSHNWNKTLRFSK